MTDMLPVPATVAGRTALESAIADPRGVLVAVDFDGTLAPIVDDPAAARAHPDAADLLSELAPLVAGVAVVTGRPAADAVRFGSLDDVPGLVVVGHYGMERWSDGELASDHDHAAVEDVRDGLTLMAQDLADPGVVVEDKGLSVAVHTRRSADPSAAMTRLRPMVDQLAREGGLEVVPGRDVLEIRPPGSDKGSAITGLIAEFGARTVLYAGDDLGDLPAMRAVQASTEVTGLVVVIDSPGIAPEMAEVADLVVDGPDGLMALLALLRDAWS